MLPVPTLNSMTKSTFLLYGPVIIVGICVAVENIRGLLVFDSLVPRLTLYFPGFQAISDASLGYFADCNNTP